MKKIKGIPFKEEEESEHFAQFTVTHAPDSKIKLKRFLLIILYAAFAGAFIVIFTVLTKMAAVVALLPFLMWILWFFTWKYTQIEYCYIVCKNVFYVYKINGYGKAKEIMKFSVSACESVTPADKVDTSSADVSDFRSSRACPDSYAAVFTGDVGRVCVLFDASAKLLCAMRYYGGDTVEISNVSR